MLHLPLKETGTLASYRPIAQTKPTCKTKPGAVLPNVFHLHSNTHLVVPGVPKYTPQGSLGWPTTQEEMHTPTRHCLPESHCPHQQRSSKTLRYHKATQHPGTDAMLYPGLQTYHRTIGHDDAQTPCHRKVPSWLDASTSSTVVQRERESLSVEHEHPSSPGLWRQRGRNPLRESGVGEETSLLAMLGY